MCWINYLKPKAKTAVKPIKVYKVLKKDKTSPFRGAVYSFGKPMPKVTINIEELFDCLGERFFIIRAGYYSYSKYMCYKSNDEGIHIYADFFRKKLNYFDQRHAIFEADIPAGTKYYKNRFGEIVSETLVVTNKTVESNNIINKIFRRIWQIKKYI